ncbi:MAG: signal peptide peptidase SppA [Asticcacaulis sp.]
MKSFFITLSAVIVAMLLVLVVLPIGLIFGIAAAARPQVPASVVLSLDLRQKMSDQSAKTPLDFVTGGSLSTLDVVTTLHHAAEDSRVKGVFIRLPEGGMSPVAAEEIRNAILYVTHANKTVIAHSQGLYPDTMVAASYMLGSASGNLWMQPQASLQVTGMSTSTLFMKRAFDKYGVKAEYEQRYEFKNAVNPYLYSDYTPAHREATLGWMTSIYQSMIHHVAADRKTDAAKLQASLEAGPYSAEQALKLGLVDKLGQVSEAQDEALKRAGDGAQIMDLTDYEDTIKAPITGSVVAVIDGEGAIMTGISSGGSFNRSSDINSDAVSEAFLRAAKDSSVKAIIFRVSSPGGSDTASQQIAQAMKAARAAGKPVVVSMGDYAASGGYWVSAGASYIVANPSTLTGSIGVYGGKFAIGDALSRFGLDDRDIYVGSPLSAAYSESQPFSPEQRASISSWMDEIYNSFILHVAKGRHLPEATVRDIARGRVWTGQQALPLKLVDKLGGFYDAVEAAKRLGKIDAKAEVRLVNYSNKNTLFGAAQQSVHMGMAGIRALSFMGWAMSDPKAESLMSQVRTEGLREQGANVLSPELYQPNAR